MNRDEARRKKRFCIAMAAMFYTKKPKYAHKYARVSRLLLSCTHSLNLTFTPSSTWVQIHLKRLGIGFTSNHDGEVSVFGDWRVTLLPSAGIYRQGGEPVPTWRNQYNVPDVTIISHHHKNGAAYETDGSLCCDGCGVKVPDTVITFHRLLTLRKRT